jgi:hypothetical protein
MPAGICTTESGPSSKVSTPHVIVALPDATAGASPFKVHWHVHRHGSNVMALAQPPGCEESSTLFLDGARSPDAALKDADCPLMEARHIGHAATLMFTLNFPILINLTESESRGSLRWRLS